MFKIIRNLVYLLVVFLMVSPLVSCGGGGGGGGTDTGTGTLGISLTDAPADYQAVFVTIVEVEVNHEVEGWLPPLAGLDLPKTINLLDFTNGVRTQLGIVDLEPGHYNQMRLRLSEEESANYVIDSLGNTIKLKVPSGGQTGIKLVNGFDIESSVSTDLILDFDVHNSIHAHPAGKTDSWRLRPTIKVVEINNSVSGTVVTAPVVEAPVGDAPVAEAPAAEIPVEDASVSAQVYDVTPGIDFKNEVERIAGSFSEEDGTYFMFLPINTSGSPYNIVATKTVYEPEIVVYKPECQSLDSTASAEYIDVNFTLAPADKIGNVSGSITGLPVPADPEDDYSVFLSIRKFVDCDGIVEPETWVEVELIKFVNDVNDSEELIPYGPIILPGAGDYEIVAWADGAGTLPPFDINIAADGADIQEIDLGEQIDFGF